jgi:uncharacterized membrane protein
VIKVEWFYWLTGAVFVVMALQMLRDTTNPKRYGSAAFWGLLGLSFAYGTWVVDGELPAAPLGVAVLAMAGLAGAGLTGRGTTQAASSEERAASAARFGNKLFIPAIAIPVVAALCATLVKHWSIGGSPVLETGNETLLGLGIGSVVALVIGMALLRERRVSVPVHAGRTMLESMGPTLVLPQLLAVLGAIFATAGVGTQVGRITSHVLPHNQVYFAVALYCVGMAVFTVIMGNAFAAFPVMTAAIGWPVLIVAGHGNPPVVLAVGMLAGFCGTLLTPMAANFNIIPATLLELKDTYGPIKAQAPTAFALLACNIGIMCVFAF